MKKLIFIFLIVITIFLIYIFSSNKNISYLNISDKENSYSMFIVKYIDKKNKLLHYNNAYSKQDYRITELINDIDNNKKIKFNGRDETIKNALIKYDIITLNIGNTDLYNKFNSFDVNEMYDYVDEILIDYEKLFKKIRKITKEKIIVFAYTSSNIKEDEIIAYYNERLEELCESNKIEFLYINKNSKKNLIKIIDAML